MDDGEYGVLKSKFLKIYAGLATPLRDEIIAVVGDETFNWTSAKAEFMYDSDPEHKKNAILILKQLLEIGVLGE